MAEQSSRRNPFKDAVEGGRERREVALRIAEVALPEIVEGQRIAAARMNDLLTRDGLERVSRINDALSLDVIQIDWCIRQMAEAIADPATLFALAEASDSVERILWARGIEEKMKVAFTFLGEVGVDISKFENVVHSSAAERVRKTVLAIMKRQNKPRFGELIALMSLPYNGVSADVIKSALAYGIKATADSRASISLADRSVRDMVRAAGMMEKLLVLSDRLKDDYETYALPIGEIMNRAGTVNMARENGLVDPNDLNVIVSKMRDDMGRIKGDETARNLIVPKKTGLVAFDKLVKQYLGEIPSAIEDASQAISGSHSTMVANNANAAVIIQKAESYYSLAAAEGLRVLMTHETLTMVMNYAIVRLNRKQRDEAMAVVSQMVQLINLGRYEEAFVLGAERNVLPREYAEMRLSPNGSSGQTEAALNEGKQ